MGLMSDAWGLYFHVITRVAGSFYWHVFCSYRLWNLFLSICKHDQSSVTIQLQSNQFQSPMNKQARNRPPPAVCSNRTTVHAYKRVRIIGVWANLGSWYFDMDGKFRSLMQFILRCCALHWRGGVGWGGLPIFPGVNDVFKALLHNNSTKF